MIILNDCPWLNFKFHINVYDCTLYCGETNNNMDSEDDILATLCVFDVVIETIVLTVFDNVLIVYTVKFLCIIIIGLFNSDKRPKHWE